MDGCSITFLHQLSLVNSNEVAVIPISDVVIFLFVLKLVNPTPFPVLVLKTFSSLLDDLEILPWVKSLTSDSSEKEFLPAFIATLVSRKCD